MMFNPADIQTIGIGFAAFLVTLIAIFIFLSARKERVGKAMFLMMMAVALWSWFGFFYGIVPDFLLARLLRVISVIGIVWIGVTSIYFSLTYLSERRSIGSFGSSLFTLILAMGTALTLLLVGDLFGSERVIGALTVPATLALAPEAGYLFPAIIIFYAVCTVITGVLLALRTRASVDSPDRLQANLLFSSLTLGLVLGGTRFLPWYGIIFHPLLGALAVPLFIFSALYSIKRYRLLNIEVAAAQLFVFALWAFTFFRLLLDRTRKDFVIDSTFFFGVVILGVLLLRSILMEIRFQKQLSDLTFERVKSEFVTVAAHQLRAPLQTVSQTFLALGTTGDMTLSEKQRALVNAGSSAANALTLIMDDLLDTERISHGAMHFHMEAGDIREAVLASSNIFLDTAKEKGLAYTIDLPQTPLQAVFDRGKLAFAIESLIDNAVKYTKEGGSVSVRALQKDGHVLISIVDTGIGIPKKDQRRVYEKFFRGKSAKELVPDGTGLGLYLAQNIAHGHGATLSVTSEEGKGTTATISLMGTH